MKVLFLSISSLPHLSEHSISLDLLRQIRRHGHELYVVSSLERRANTDTYLAKEDGASVLRVRIGNNKKTGRIRKGITTLTTPSKYIKAIKKYFRGVRFDLVLYPTPPVTLCKVVEFIKKRDGAESFLVLKDIFPQNALDIGMMKKTGLSGFIYRRFRKTEKKLYALSDRIGCMSRANVEYLLSHNPEISADKVGISPNSVEPRDLRISREERREIRARYGIPEDACVYVYGGNLGRPQGVPYIIECLKLFANRTDAYFLIVGDGTEYSRLEAFFSEQNPTNMKLMKRIPKEDYDRLVAGCDVGLVFLDKRFTIPNFPSRILPYMQSGLPVLAATDKNTDLGRVITEGGFGAWCESSDPEDFVKLIDGVCPEQFPKMGERAYEYLLMHYTAEKAYHGIFDKYENQG